MKFFADYDSIKVGDRHEIKKTITEDDIRKFVDMTGDDNPLHVDRSFARETSFKDVVVHGMLGASFISTVIGTKLPGPGALWVSQNMEFLLPVRVADSLTISCTVTAKHDRERLLELETTILNQNRQLVLQGQGKVKVLTQRHKPAAEPIENRQCRVAIVTGGAGGIGEAICMRLARQGFQVAVCYNSNEARALHIASTLRDEGAKAIAVQANIGLSADVDTLYSTVTRQFGQVDVLVNNASPRINPRPMADMAWDDFQHHMDVQLKGAFLIIQKCAADMQARRYGRIVNVTSQATKGTPTTGWTAYATAKAALAMFSRNIAAELGPFGITVNCVAPGMTETALIGDISEKQQMIVARQTPLRRLAQPEDIASAVAYLASDEAAFVTGHTIEVNGGMVMS